MATSNTYKVHNIHITLSPQEKRQLTEVAKYHKMLERDVIQALLKREHLKITLRK